MSEIINAVEILRKHINSRNKNKNLLLTKALADYRNHKEWEKIYAEFISRDLLSLGYTAMALKISEHPLLISEQYQDILPNSFKTLFELSFLSDSELKRAIKAGRVEKNMSLTAAKRLRSFFYQEKTS